MSTQPPVLVTSDHKKGRDTMRKIRDWYDQMRFDPESAQKLNEAPGLKEYIQAGFKRFSSNKHPTAKEIETYFCEVYGLTINLAGVAFPEKKGMHAFMAVPPNLNEDTIMKRLTTHFKVGTYAYRSPIANNIDRAMEQKRSKELYVFSHRGRAKPDTDHLVKSYNDAVKENMLFLNSLEYLLCIGFHMWKHGKCMDAKGWTRTSSLWSDGDLVDGGWDPSNRGLYLSSGNRDDRSPSSGPRELFLSAT